MRTITRDSHAVYTTILPLGGYVHSEITLCHHDSPTLRLEVVGGVNEWHEAHWHRFVVNHVLPALVEAGHLYET